MPDARRYKALRRRRSGCAHWQIESRLLQSAHIESGCIQRSSDKGQNSEEFCSNFCSCTTLVQDLKCTQIASECKNQSRRRGERLQTRFLLGTINQSIEQASRDKYSGIRIKNAIAQTFPVTTLNFSQVLPRVLHAKSQTREIRLGHG